MMSFCKILVSLSFTAELLSSSVEGKKKVFHPSRVIGGYETDVSNFPFIASFQIHFGGNDWRHDCGGSIISAKAVLTAAHCLANRNPWMYRVVAGVTDWRMAEWGQWRQPARFDIHPDYGGHPGYANDVAVALLAMPFRFFGLLRPLRFPSNNIHLAEAWLREIQKAHVQCLSPGWGTTNPHYLALSSTLKVTPATLMTSRDCASSFCQRIGSYCGTNFDRMHQVCVSSPDGIVCNGDSGGPLVCNGFVVGTVSWKVSCIPGWPHIYSDLVPILEMALKYM